MDSRLSISAIVRRGSRVWSIESMCTSIESIDESDLRYWE
jgi:hypothetical protein